jgi:hypothetical protein
MINAAENGLPVDMSNVYSFDYQMDLNTILYTRLILATNTSTTRRQNETDFVADKYSRSWLDTTNEDACHTAKNCQIG